MIRVSIGTEPKQYIASQVLKSSILRRCSETVSFTESWKPVELWHHRLKSAPKLEGGTAFSAWRWLVPDVYGRSGRAIYMDADQVVLADIVELWDAIEDGKPIAAVRNAIGIFGKKTPEPDHTQTSVMVIDCKKAGWDYRLLASVANRKDRDFVRACEAKGNKAKSPYAAVMQAGWIPREEITELDPAWNHFGIVQDDTKLVHWSHVKSQPYRNPNHPTAHIFAEELKVALESGHVTQSELRHSVHQRYIHEDYLRCLPAPSA